ncbi:hypothetical protein [Konateibacter massiliensis]|uniref:hypothetical protein n=1 Tax=Konateibacter massiliensis TaxID=2002841 RepID=UPI000C15A38B|nr:hypothetical protein [Konateibacter massiliensis]
MTDNELLLAISGMMDTKLKAELQPIKNEMQMMNNRMQALENRMDNRMQALEDRMDSKMQGLEGKMQSLENKMQSMDNKMQTIEKRMHNMELFQENVLLPRLDNIEACYTDTYLRYRNYADKMDATIDDVDLLKRVVAEHSEKLQKIS